jgi:zinc protease
MFQKTRIYKGIRYFLIFVIAAVFMSCASFNNKWPHELSSLPSDPAVIYGKLGNGLRYVLMKNNNPEQRVSMHLYVQVGSLNETDDQQGFAHFLEHMLFNGSTNFKPGELVKYFQSIGMMFGPDANAHTGFNKTVYDLLLPDPGPQALEKAFVVLKDYAQGALLTESEIEKERKVVLSEKRARDSASYRTFISTLKFELPDAILSKRLPIGKEQTIREAKRRAMKHFYDAWYRPENMIIVMVGDFDAKSAVDLIKSKFKNLKPRAPVIPKPDFGTIDHKGIKPFYHFEKEAPATSVTICTVDHITPKPDSIELQERFLVSDIADRIIQTRLDQLISRPETPFTSAGASSLGFFLNEIKYTSITAKTSPENWEQSLALLEQTLRQALKYGFTSAELQKAKQDLTAELNNEVQQASTRKSQELSGAIIRHIAANRVFMSPAQEKQLFLPMLNSLTLKHVNKVFQKNWASKHKLLLVTGNADLTTCQTKPEQQIPAEFNSSIKVPVSMPVDIKTGVFPYLPTPKHPGTIIKNTEFPDPGIIQIDFENNIRLNLKPTDFQANQIKIRIGFGKGRFSEPSDLPGLAKLAQQVINESGLGTLDKQQLNNAMAGKSTELVFVVKEDRFYFQGKTIPEETELLFQLIYAHLKDPGFRRDAYKLVMERFMHAYKELAGSINGAMTLSGKRFLAGGDNRFGLPLLYSDFNKLTLPNIKEWILPILNQAKLEVSVTGDFDPQSIIKLASTYIGSLEPRHGIRIKSDSGTPVFPFGESKEISIQSRIPKALLVLAYPTDDFWNIKRTRRLNILAQIFSNRLHEKIRENLGAAYSPYAFNKASLAYKGYGLFQVFITLAPEQAQIVKNQVEKIARDIATHGVTTDELTRALNPILSAIKDMLRKNSYWLNQVLSGSKQHPERLEWNRTILKDYSGITIEEISLLAKKYLKNHNAAAIIIKPQ